MADQVKNDKEWLQLMPLRVLSIYNWNSLNSVTHC